MYTGPDISCDVFYSVIKKPLDKIIMEFKKEIIIQLMYGPEGNS